MSDARHYPGADIPIPSPLTAARREVSTEIRRFFEVEIRNEAQGGATPSTLYSAIDSLIQAPEDVLSDWFGSYTMTCLLNLLAICVLVPGTTELRDLL